MDLNKLEEMPNEAWLSVQENGVQRWDKTEQKRYPLEANYRKEKTCRWVDRMKTPGTVSTGCLRIMKNSLLQTEWTYCPYCGAKIERSET